MGNDPFIFLRVARCLIRASFDRLYIMIRTKKLHALFCRGFAHFPIDD